MSVTTKNIIAQFKSTLQHLYGERLSKIILFGSYARGEARDDSDIDFLIVLKDKNISVFKEIEMINNHAYHIILESGKIISFIPTTEDKFENSPNHFYTQVKREGKFV
jgi:predicted nucleotidyltransferase